ncbi:hypothetical protein ACWGLE_35910 [Streptomyces sp. NPDC055897]
MQISQDPSNVANVLAAAFPSCLADDVRDVLAVVPDAGLSPASPFEVEVQGETVAIPSRIYNDEARQRLLPGR